MDGVLYLVAVTLIANHHPLPALCQIWKAYPTSEICMHVMGWHFPFELL